MPILSWPWCTSPPIKVYQESDPTRLILEQMRSNSIMQASTLLESSGLAIWPRFSSAGHRPKTSPSTQLACKGLEYEQLTVHSLLTPMTMFCYDWRKLSDDWESYTPTLRIVGALYSRTIPFQSDPAMEQLGLSSQCLLQMQETCFKSDVCYCLQCFIRWWYQVDLADIVASMCFPHSNIAQILNTTLLRSHLW